MAGDWIPITVDLTRRREVLIVAAKCGMTPREVVGGLIEFWGWVSTETVDGRLRNVFVATLVAQFGLQECYWRALQCEGWLEESEEGIVVPNFDRWLSNGAKARLGNALRQREYRRKAAKGATNVVTSVATNVATKALPQNSTVQKSKESITTLRSVIDSEEASQAKLPEPSKKHPSDDLAIVSQVEFPHGWDLPEVRAALADWLAYKRQRRESYKDPPKQLGLLLRQFQTDGCGPECVRDAVNHSMANNYQGCFVPRTRSGPAAKPTRPTLDVGAIMRQKAAEKGEVYDET